MQHLTEVSPCCHAFSLKALAKRKQNSVKLPLIKRIVFTLILLSSGIFVAFFVVEIALRVAGYSAPTFYMTDASRGYALDPESDGWYRKEGVSYITINSDGYRDVEHTIEKPAGTVRIAVIGDSYTEALQVAHSEAFYSVMRERLIGCRAFNGSNIEVLSFGVSGYGTAQEFITLKEEVWKYSPDIVMLAVTTNNDITDNYRQFKRTDIPYYVYQNDKLVLDDSFRNSSGFRFNDSYLSSAGSWIRNHSRTIQALLEAHLKLKYRYDEWRRSGANDKANAPPNTSAQTAQPSQPVAAQPVEAQPVEVGIDHQIYRVPANEQWNEAWRVTEGIILMTAEEVRNRNAKFLVVTLSNGPQVYPQPERRAVHLKYVGAEDHFYPDKRIADLSRRNGIAAVTLAPDLAAYAEKNQIYLHGFDENIGHGHWNQAGHKAAGEILAGHLCGGILK